MSCDDFRYSWSRVTGGLSALVLLLTLAAPAEALPRTKDQWLRLDTEHFTLISNSSERNTQEVGADLEKFISVMGGLIGREPASPLPSTVFVFRNDKAFEPYKLLWEGKPANVAGFFLNRTDGNLIAFNGDQRLEAAGILYHELMHYVLNSNYSPLPVWASEGLGELYSTFEVDGDKVHVGKPVESHVFWLRDHPLIPLAELFETDVDSPTYNEGNRQGSFYAQSWLLIHYLLLSNDQQRRSQLMQFLDQSRRGIETEEAFRRVFATDYKALETELRKYARQSKFYYQTLPAPIELGEVASPRPLSRHEALCWLGDLLVSQPGRGDEAEEHFRAGLELQADAGECHLGMGRVMEQGKRFREAEGHFRKATELAPESFVAWYHWGMLRIEASRSVDASTLAALQRSVELQPDFAPAWAALSMAHGMEDTFNEQAIGVGERAHALFPSRGEVALTLLHHYVRGGRGSDAHRLFDDFFVGYHDPVVVRQAQVNLWLLEAQQAEVLIASDQATAQQVEAAIVELERIRREATGVPELAWIDGRVQELRSFVNGQSQVDQFNEAVKLLNAGYWVKGRKLLEEVAAQNPEGEFGAAVREALEQVKAAGSR